MEREELSAWLRLLLTPGVGSAGSRKLLARFGLPQQVFAQSAAALESCVSARQADSLLQTPANLADQVQTTWEWLAQHPGQRHVLTLGDPRYPAALLDTEDPPLLLYAMGAERHLQRGWADSAPSSIAVVGSRNPTAQGLANARQFSQILAQAGLTVVSGLALGIDGAAHEGALEGAAEDQLATIAVVGTGLDRVYPKPHFELAHRIAQQGLLISEYPLGTPPLSENFPKRNRIISGLSHATLVVEAALKSGSLITARLAVEQGLIEVCRIWLCNASVTIEDIHIDNSSRQRSNDLCRFSKHGTVLSRKSIGRHKAKRSCQRNMLAPTVAVQV